MVLLQPKGSAEHQRAGNDGPRGYPEHKGKHSQTRPKGDDGCKRNVGNAFQHEETPALVPASGPHGCNDCEYAIDQHVSCKDEHKRQNGRARRNEGDNSEYDPAKAAQRNGPPVLAEEGLMSAVIVSPSGSEARGAASLSGMCSSP